jgi:hypothetical protein
VRSAASLGRCYPDPLLSAVSSSEKISWRGLVEENKQHLFSQLCRFGWFLKRLVRGTLKPSDTIISSSWRLLSPLGATVRAAARCLSLYYGCQQWLRRDPTRHFPAPREEGQISDLVLRHIPLNVCTKITQTSRTFLLQCAPKGVSNTKIYFATSKNNKNQLCKSCLE